ncbi:hypothetical protein TRAPUB_6972 [Trametes pubescens]|uniref:Uncharacterized protein n=1 Tax=Trametes pubescens TaxID=154538 RepID=A0A1M2V4F9_TRAPU|nr:hypothetical protein TRAPUB_6972 [Trametes pubescens]
MAATEYKHLTPEQREQFLQHGWVKIPKAVKEEHLRAFTENVWVRLGYDPEDKSSWTKEKVALFTHFLDSGEQGLTVIVLFNDIVPRAGGTYIAPGGIKNVVQWLYEHPEGANEMPQDPDGSRSICSIQTCSQFIELTGEAGDVILLHPFMPHSASKNHLRIPRFITNPPVTLKEPFNLNRANPEEYSLVELKILRELGAERLPDWKIAAPRRRFVPWTRTGKDATIIEEVERMKAHALKTGGSVDSMHINGPVPYQVVVAS